RLSVMAVGSNNMPHKSISEFEISSANHPLKCQPDMRRKCGTREYGTRKCRAGNMGRKYGTKGPKLVPARGDLKRTSSYLSSAGALDAAIPVVVIAFDVHRQGIFVARP